ncbi:MAG TPA: MBL fold metallo-hydrolase [Solirubrobacteraceae bacterium]|nr:MBL fold metallo-hydrolase [Solirubrobacteraceae bacterium]
MRVHLCGVRGSTPAPGADFLRYGGHTSCVALAHDDARTPTLILDAGTGIRSVTRLLAEQPFRGTILLSHLHWDHVQGLPFFTAGDNDGTRATLLLPVQEDGRDAETVLERAMSPPHFPMTPSQMRGAWTFGTASAGEWESEGFRILAREIPHKGGTTFGYRVSDGHSTLTYMPDHCPTSLGSGPDGCGEYHPAALELAHETDVLIHDAQLLTPEELDAEARFGHAAADYAAALGRRTSARQVLLFHHRPDRTDAALDELARRFDAATVTPAAQDAMLEL